MSDLPTVANSAPSAPEENGGGNTSPVPEGRVELVRTLADGRPKRELPGYVRKRLEDGKPGTKQWALTRHDEMVQRVFKDYFMVFNTDLEVWELWMIHPERREEYCLVFRLWGEKGEFLEPDERIVWRIKMHNRDSGLDQAEVERLEDRAREIRDKERNELFRLAVRQIAEDMLSEITDDCRLAKALRPTRGILVPAQLVRQGAAHA